MLKRVPERARGSEGRSFGLIFAGYLSLASHYNIIVYSVAIL